MYKYNTVNILLDSLVRSEKTYAFDLNKFPKKVNKILIIGLSGSGSSQFANRIKNSVSHCELINLDEFWTKEMEQEIRSGGTEENVVRKNLRKVGEYLKKILFNKSKCCVIEGLNIAFLYELYGETFIKVINKYPTVIFGTSVIKSSINQLKANKFKFKIKSAWYTMFDESELKRLRERLLMETEREIKEINP
jgi:adenylate kinase family enzyme